MSETRLLPPKELRRFQKIWFEQFEESLSLEEASVIALSFLESVSVLLGRKTRNGGEC